MKTLQAVQVGCFKDGGTKKILAENGHYYYIDGRIRSKTKGQIFDRMPSLKGARILNIKVELIPFRGNETNFHKFRTEFLKRAKDH